MAAAAGSAAVRSIAAIRFVSSPRCRWHSESSRLIRVIVPASRRQQRAGRLQPVSCLLPCLVHHRDASLEVLDVAVAEASPANPVDPDDRPLFALELSLVDQGVGQHQFEVDAVSGPGDSLAQEGLGAVGMAEGKLDAGGHPVEGGVTRVLLDAPLHVPASPGEVVVLPGQVGGLDQHVGLVGAKLQGPRDVGLVGGRAELAAIPVPLHQRQGRAGIVRHHPLDLAIGVLGFLEDLPLEPGQPGIGGNPRPIVFQRTMKGLLGIVGLGGSLVALTHKVLELGRLGGAGGIVLDPVVKAFEMAECDLVAADAGLHGEVSAAALELEVVAVGQEGLLVDFQQVAAASVGRNDVGGDAGVPLPGRAVVAIEVQVKAQELGRLLEVSGRLGGPRHLEQGRGVAAELELVEQVHPPTHHGRDG